MGKKTWLWFLPVIVPGVLAMIAAVFILALFLIKVVWAWTIPDLFPERFSRGS